MPKKILDKINLTRFLSCSVIGFILMEYADEIVFDLENDKKRELSYASALTILSCYLLLVSLKYNQQQKQLFNKTTFLHKTPVNLIEKSKLMVLDKCAFDLEELVQYAQNDFIKIYRNPHTKKEFSLAAKKIIKSNFVLALFTKRLERHLNNQRRHISATFIDKLIDMLLELDINENGDDVFNRIDLVDDEEGDYAEQAALQHIILDDPAADQDDDIIHEDFASEAVADIASDNLSADCDAAHLDFILYLETLNLTKRKWINDYIIEVPVLQGNNEYQRLRFQDALIGGNDNDRCVITMQIFLWQMVVSFRPKMLMQVPDSVTSAAKRIHLQIQQLNPPTTIMGDVLKFASNYGGRFFAAATLKNPVQEEDIPAQVQRYG